MLNFLSLDFLILRYHGWTLKLSENIYSNIGKGAFVPVDCESKVDEEELKSIEGTV